VSVLPSAAVAATSATAATPSVIKNRCLIEIVAPSGLTIGLSVAAV
jgi:hypothetical protein